MKVTRDVIYDLLPGYFAGDASPDTRALVDEFLRDDPEFAHMMQRFRTVFKESGFKESGPVDGAVTREQQTFDRARALLNKRSELRGIMAAFALAAMFVAGVFYFAGRPFGIQFWAMAGAFAVTSLIAGFQLEMLYRDHPELRQRSRPHDV